MIRTCGSWLRFFYGEGYLEYKGGRQVTPEEKRVWAENLLRQKQQELGRTPTKKDFDDVACSQIKAYLGPWPRALESAGLKVPKENKSQE